MTAPDQTERLIVCSEIATSPGGEHLDVFRVPGVAGERSFLPHNSRARCAILQSEHDGPSTVQNVPPRRDSDRKPSTAAPAK